MSLKFEFLKPFVNSRSKGLCNWFTSVPPAEIEKAEKILKYPFPNQLKEFYQEIGYGYLAVPHNPTSDYDFYDTNRINSPAMIVEMILHGQESGLISKDLAEDLHPGDLPFFEIGDSSRFMIMKTFSDNSNAVWFMGYKKIEDSFETFIRRLYFEDPSYYSKNW